MTIIDALTPREMQILRLLAQGMTDPQIGAQLGIASGATRGAVRTHNSNMYSKLGVTNRTQAVLTALALGLTKVD